MKISAFSLVLCTREKYWFFSPHSMKYIWYSPQKSKYHLFIWLSEKFNQQNKWSLCFSIKCRYSDILLKKRKLHLFCCNNTCYCVNMVSLTSASASRYITLASCYHPPYQSKSSMYIRGAIPRNFAEMAEAVPIAVPVYLRKSISFKLSGLPLVLLQHAIQNAFFLAGPMMARHFMLAW